MHGEVVICGSSQAGTVVLEAEGSVWVLTRSKDIWIGPKSQCRAPQNQEDLDACPLVVERQATKLLKRAA